MELISQFREEIIVFILGMLPISEARGAVAVGIIFFDMPAFKTYAIAVLGNILFVAPLLIFLYRFVDLLSHRFYFANRFFSWLFEHTRKRHGDHFHHRRWAPLALFIFVALPVPLTGAWSGALAAVVFGIPLLLAILAISLGVAAAGGITLGLVSAGILGAQAIFQFLK